MTEEQIERAVERKIDAIDRLFLLGTYDQAHYDMALKAVDAFAEAAYRQLAARKG